MLSFRRIRNFSEWRKNIRGGVENQKLLGTRNPQSWYTGQLPQNTAGFNGKYLKSLPQPRLDNQTTQSALAFFNNGWTLYEVLFSSLQGEEAFYIPPAHGLRHPLIFYYGHTAALFLNKFFVAGLIPKTVNPTFERLFEVGVDEMRWDDDLKYLTAWPTVSEVQEFRRETYQLVNQVIKSTNFDKPITWHNDPRWAIFMGCDHDRIHLETSAQLIRELPLSLVKKPEELPPYPPAAPTAMTTNNSNRLVSVKGQEVKLGKPRNFPSHGWDNEYGDGLIVKVEDFQASQNLVSNGEYLEFVKDLGYAKDKYWTSDGWNWRKFRNTLNPKFWERVGPVGNHDYKLRQVFEVLDMNWNLPVIANHHESHAFCKWKAEKTGQDVRLCTEAEYQLLLEPQERCSNDQTMPSAERYNLGWKYGGEQPVGQVINSQGFSDAKGNLWQWTSDKMMPFKGFEPHPFYMDFTEPCFDGKHYVIKGGSFASTSGCGTGVFDRFHFRPHFHQLAGIRYAVSHQMDKIYYETDELLDQYLDLHFSPTSTFEWA